VTAIGIVAYGAVSALGDQRNAVSAGNPGERARVVIRRDSRLEAAGLGRPFAARVDLVFAAGETSALLGRALGQCAAELDAKRPGWRGERVGLVLGTACGGMRAATRAFEAIDAGERIVDVEAPTYFGPMAVAARGLEIPLDPSVLVLGACASSTLAIGLAMRFLERGQCDLVLAGGFDDVTPFVASGFEALRAISATGRPRPFRVDRDGMVLGEGAAVLALARATPPGLALRGFGAASDAAHVTAPDRDGYGLARAAAAALDEAGRPAVDLVSANATATPMNDLSEFNALTRALGADEARNVLVHPFKAQIGHTMGAGGALELLACVDAVERGILPATAGQGAVDPATPVRITEIGSAGTVGSVLKLSSAFGGCNAALVLGNRSAQPKRRQTAFVYRGVYVDRTEDPSILAGSCRLSEERIARGDPLVRLALTAVAKLEASCGPLRGAGVIVGTALATVETNAVFARRLRERGAASVEPRRFPYTSPNLVAGECAAAFGLTGPSFSTGGGMHAGIEALAAASILVEAADAETMVVVAVDEGGSVGHALAPRDTELPAGAVAVLLSTRSEVGGRVRAQSRVGALTLRRGMNTDGTAPAGHRLLMPLVEDSSVTEITGVSPPDVFARIVFDPV
jgi:3-oxoacyl-[acyl-carrier-protein] synthase-1/3-oxoacyl-[acyl-carrier-protein] synthase II